MLPAQRWRRLLHLREGQVDSSRRDLWILSFFVQASCGVLSALSNEYWKNTHYWPKAVSSTQHNGLHSEAWSETELAGQRRSLTTNTGAVSLVLGSCMWSRESGRWEGRGGKASRKQVNGLLLRPWGGSDIELTPRQVCKLWARIVRALCLSIVQKNGNLCTVT